ncbi:unnamed protein product [Heligmosomoides polygyrus]|uniref:Ovule protein n=1 Tax=Heligmosomoides polygyrus TaxID=6339 RepID=A0A183FCL0_HELPZ|nr:unnamed protein product [Heligmosomoides polygyrus]
MEERDTTKENATPEEVSRKTLENEESEWEACVRIVEEGKNRSLAVLSETRVSKQARWEVELEWKRVAEQIEGLLKEEKAKVLPRGLSEVITETIEQRGIESE